MFNDLVLSSFLSSFILCLQPFCCISVFLFVLYFVIMSMLLTSWDFFQAARFLCVQYICWWWAHSTCALSTRNVRDKWNLLKSFVHGKWSRTAAYVFRSRKEIVYWLLFACPTANMRAYGKHTLYVLPKSYDAPVCYVHTTSSNLSFTLDQLITQFIPMNTLSHFHKVCFYTSISHYTMS